MEKKKVKKIKKVKKEDSLIELDSSEVSLIIEALRDKEKAVREDMFYRNDHPREFYQIYLERYFRLKNKFDAIIPRAVFIKMPKF